MTNCVTTFVHPFASVVVKVYVVLAEGETTIVLVFPAAGFQEYEYPGTPPCTDAFNVAFCPAQLLGLPEIVVTRAGG